VSAALQVRVSSDRGVVPKPPLSKSIVVIRSIVSMNLSGVDVNLLVAFDALVNERSVTRAARRVGLGQPAMSNALARLRALFDDRPLIRSAREMVPTARALELAGPIHRALVEIQHALDATTTFDPARSERTIRLAVTDYVAVVLLPRLLRHLARVAP